MTVIPWEAAMLRTAIRRHLAGDRMAFNIIFKGIEDRFNNEYRRYARILPSHLHSDLRQQGLLGVLTALRKVDCSFDDPGQYLVWWGRTNMSRFTRVQTRPQTYIEDLNTEELAFESPQTPEEEAMSNEAGDALQELIGRLPKTLRDAAALRFLPQHMAPMEEIARKLSTNRRRVSELLDEAREQLKDMAEENGILLDLIA